MDEATKNILRLLDGGLNPNPVYGQQEDDCLIVLAAMGCNGLARQAEIVSYLSYTVGQRVKRGQKQQASIIAGVLHEFLDEQIQLYSEDDAADSPKKLDLLRRFYSAHQRQAIIDAEQKGKK